MAIATIGIEADTHTQIFGRKTETSIQFRGELVLRSALGPNDVLRVNFTWPLPEETNKRRIGAAIVHHSGKGKGSCASIITGGPGHGEIVLGINSAPGQDIESNVELWTQ